MLDDIFAKKKNDTLQVRLSAMMLYIRWARAKGLNPFPLDEDQCYEYVDQLQRDGAPATRASSFRSALAFCKGTLELEGVDEALKSARISGSAHRSFLTKRILRQRDALTVHQVNILERLVCEQSFQIQDRIFAGHCLVCIYGRLRFGDSQGIQHEPTVESDCTVVDGKVYDPREGEAVDGIPCQTQRQDSPHPHLQQECIGRWTAEPHHDHHGHP